MRSEMYIDGCWTASNTGKFFDVVNTATEAVIHRLPSIGEEDVDKAVHAARRAFDKDRCPGCRAGNARLPARDRDTGSAR